MSSLSRSKKLIPLATIMTPNLPEAEVLLEKEITDASQAASDLLTFGARAALLKGGHDSGEKAIDILVTPEGTKTFESFRHPTQNTHGTGCTLASALACFLARGLTLEQAVEESKFYITRAIEHADVLEVGHGAGPVHHFHEWWK